MELSRASRPVFLDHPTPYFSSAEMSDAHYCDQLFYVRAEDPNSGLLCSKDIIDWTVSLAQTW